MPFNPKDGMTNLDRLSTVRGYWIGTWGNEVQIISSSGAFVGPGGIIGPGSSTDKAIVRFSGTDGNTLLNSSAILEDSGAVTFGTVAAPITHVFNGNEIRLITDTDGTGVSRTENINAGTLAGAANYLVAGPNNAYAYNLYSPNQAAVNWFNGVMGTNSQYEIRYGGSSGVSSTATSVFKIDSSGVTTIGSSASAVSHAINGLEILQTVSSASQARIRTQNTGAGDAILATNVSGTGDPHIHFAGTGLGTAWHAGVDNSDSDKFVIGTGIVPGVGTAFSIDTAGTVTTGISAATTRQIVNGGLDILATASDYYSVYLHAATTNPNTINYSILNLPEINSNQTLAAYGTFTRITTPNTSFTTNVVANYVADGMLKGGSHTVTNFINYLVSNPAQWTGTNNAMFGDSTTFTGNYFLVQENSTYDSKLAGQLTAKSFIPTDSAVPTNGMYLPSANTLGFATNSLDHGSIGSTGSWTIGASGSALSHVINGSTLRLLAGATTEFALVGDSGNAASVALCGAGGSANGAVIVLYGNLHATNANITDFKNAGSSRGNISATGAWTIGSSASTVTHTANGLFRISGRAGINTTPATNSYLHLGGTHAGVAAAGWNVTAQMKASTSQTSAFYGYEAGVTSAGSSTTHALMAHFQSDVVTVVSGDTCTRFIDFYVAHSAASITRTTQWAAFADNASFSGSYFINSVNTNPSRISGYFEVANQADPGAVTDGIRIGSVDISAGNASLSLRTETAVVSESVTSDRTLQVQINGTTYKICLKA